MTVEVRVEGWAEGRGGWPGGLGGGAFMPPYALARSLMPALTPAGVIADAKGIKDGLPARNASSRRQPKSARVGVGVKARVASGSGSGPGGVVMLGVGAGMGVGILGAGVIKG